MDHPNERSSHTIAVPRGGGVAIVATFFIGLFAVYFWGDTTPITQQYFIGFLGATLVITVVSFLDDINYKVFKVKFGTQIVASLSVLFFGLVIDEISLPWVGQVSLGWLMYPVTFLWVLGLTNAYNFMDGLDGLAGGVAVIVSFFFGLITLLQGSIFVYIMSYALLAGSLGFLCFNFPPARIFMGDVGSAFLGFVFAVLAIIAARYDHSHTSFLIMPLLLFNFIFDAFFTFVRRLLNKEAVTQAHRTHLYQLLNQLGMSHFQVSLLHYAMCLTQGIAAILIIYIPGDKRVLVFLPFVAIQTVYAFVVIKKAYAAHIL